MWEATMLKDAELVMLLANLTGAFGGIFLLAIIQPPTDFYFLLPAFMLGGIAVANLVLLFLVQLGKELGLKLNSQS